MATTRSIEYEETTTIHFFDGSFAILHNPLHILRPPFVAGHKPSVSERSSMKTWSVAGYALMVAAILPLVYLRGLFSDSAIVITIQALAVVLMVWARVTFGSRSFHFAANPTEGGLVTNGPYRFIRHPGYLAMLLFVAGTALALGSTLALVPAFIYGAIILTRTAREDRFLIQNLAGYDNYLNKVRYRLVPGLW